MTIEQLCEFCGLSMQKRGRFCNKSCSNKWQHANGVRQCTLNNKTTYEHWVSKFGEAGAKKKQEEFRETMRLATAGEKNGMFGKKQPKFGAMATATKGKTLEEIHGVERALQIKAKIAASMMGSNNPMFGKINASSGKSVKGYYKNHFFRSLFELSFMKYLEAQSINLDSVMYEHFMIPYMFDGVERMYYPDFYVPSQACVYEVKPVFATSFALNIAKANAAKEFLTRLDIHYKVMTENEFPKLTFKSVRNDIDIIWDERTFKFFRQEKDE